MSLRPMRHVAPAIVAVIALTGAAEPVAENAGPESTVPEAAAPLDATAATVPRLAPPAPMVSTRPLAPPPAPPPPPPGPVVDRGPYKATLTGYVVQPSGQSRAVGEELQLREHDIVLHGTLFWFHTARLEQPVTVHVLDVDFPVEADKPLRLAVGIGGGDLASLSPRAKVFCDEPRSNTVKSLFHSLTLGLSSLKSRLARDTDTCLVDSDNNGDFDKAFVIGTKRPEDRHLVDIAPTRYVAKQLDPIAGDSALTVEFLDGGMLSGPSLSLNMKVNGASMSYAALHFFPLTGFAARRQRVPNYNPIKTKKLPLVYSIAGSRIEVTAFDPKAKVATARVLDDFGQAGFVVEPLPQYIYIYY